MDAKAKVVLGALLAFLLCILLIVPVVSDADPLFDFSPQATGFVFRSVFRNGVVITGPGGTRAALNTAIFPALISQGITFTQFKLKPCGENLPHTHPRATEILTLISGGPIQAGFVDTQGVPHTYILYPGDIIIFPRALLHFELNVGTTEAFFVSALNSENPGTLVAGAALLKLPNRVAAGAMNLTSQEIITLKQQAYPYDLQLKVDLASGCIPGRDINTYF